MGDPVPDDPQDGIVARQYLLDKKMFEKTAILWTNIYAGGPDKVDPEYNNMLNKLVEMGVGRTEALRHLSNYCWDLEKSIEAAFE